MWRLCYRGRSDHDAAAAYRGAAVVVAAGAGLSAHGDGGGEGGGEEGGGEAGAQAEMYSHTSRSQLAIQAPTAHHRDKAAMAMATLKVLAVEAEVAMGG